MEDTNMKVGFFQYAVIYRDRQANLDYIASKIKDTSFDLLVLPEFFTSGYAFDTADELYPFAENLQDSPTVKFLTRLAKSSNGLIMGTIPEKGNGKLYNTAILVGAEGLAGSYRKIHLPNYEKRFFTAGDAIKTFSVNGMRIGTAICFDIWFAPLSSAMRGRGVDIICHPACFGGAITPTIVPIRALENQCYVVSCNRTGTELFDGEPDSYRGESQIVDSDGKVLFSATSDECLAFVNIDLARVNHPRFGSLIIDDFESEHNKYKIDLAVKPSDLYDN